VIADENTVDTVFGPSFVVKPGAPLSVVFYVNSQPVPLAATVSKHTPLTFITKDRSALLMEVGKRALLILQESGQFAKSEAQITSCEPCSEGWKIEVGQFGWEEVDRRRYPRHEVKMPITVKAVMEQDGGVKLRYVKGETIDVSLGGTWIKTDEELIAGSLVEFQAELGSGEHMRALAIVAWKTEEEGVGLEFVDFLGGSRYYLHAFLSKAA
jgi:hypothetical protein